MVDKYSLRIRPEDLDEASIYFYRIWAFSALKVDPEALVLLAPEYIVLTREWVLYCNQIGENEKQLNRLASDTEKQIICISPNLSPGRVGLDVRSGAYCGPDKYRPIVDSFARAALELPPAARNRDPQRGRWVTKSYGHFEIWEGRQTRLICTNIPGEEFGFTWDRSQIDLYFYSSKSCKREGRKTREGHFKFSELKRENGGSYWNIDIFSENNWEAALLHLTPAGAGYKVFPRQLPKSFKPVSLFYAELA